MRVICLLMVMGLLGLQTAQAQQQRYTISGFVTDSEDGSLVRTSPASVESSR